MEKTYSIEIQLVSADRYSLYNMYLPGQKHAPRLAMKVEDVYNQVAGAEMPIAPGRKYLRLEIGGACKGEDDKDF